MPKIPLRHTLLTALVATVFGFLGAAIWFYAGLADQRTRAFLLANPDMLAQMVEAYEAQESAKRLAAMGDAVFTPFAGAVLGNPQGKRVLVEFTDYHCPYCKASLKDVKQLLAEDRELKVVIREWPIFEGSERAARMALAAGLQGKYAAFHEAMFRLGDVEAAARAAGLDLPRAEADAASEAVSAELAANREWARALGFSGTPAWIAGRKPINGAVGYAKLRAALAQGGPG
jgi:predicted DsbA family dithiol-disulfide isomerase